MLGKAIERADSGRKLVIYERESGLFAHWYIALRAEEECDRAARYERPLTLLLVEPRPGSDAWAAKEKLARWLSTHLRVSDVAGYYGNARFVVLMPETDVPGMERVIARLREELPDIDTAHAVFSPGAVTYEQLYEAAAAALRSKTEVAA
jgi:hypothetical protein